MNRIAFALESFKNIQDLIKFVDQKTGAVLVIAGIISTGYFQYIDDLEFTPLDEVSIWGFICFFVSMICTFCLLIIFYKTIFNILRPRIAKHYKQCDYSLFYYGHIVKETKEKLFDEYKELSEEAMLLSVIEQQFEVSQILQIKNDELIKTLFWLYILLVSVSLFILTFNLL